MGGQHVAERPQPGLEVGREADRSHPAHHSNWQDGKKVIVWREELAQAKPPLTAAATTRMMRRSDSFMTQTT
jgi:hypothetical protein